ncbi:MULTISPECIES: hypothetical protein [Streptomyces]|uniref:Uncharacterized protein n=1 Tax=Streptomyces venezuelae TaxID=54571 RepID=A0A5P2BA71_STRVZ|nr:MULTISPECIES: hypothetical protein [Streptomyces]MYY87563.1 hypothetical protein [Streptomyces sp. SID335]MYZ16569.1 hypothetical protein [Streptomyces sp. SID337]NDZ85511.1 hypothetical protein [Streptomyces sp. SID10115]NEB45519.1 hypothetical protein [Streptomyces sp. SID339]QES26810.1 hypothetical protein DEJ47_10305 [Streptomyces venezuelae]
MNGIGLTLRALHRGECRLAADLLAAADRHRADHEVRHVATDLAHWSREHARRLTEAGAGPEPAAHEDTRTACPGPDPEEGHRGLSLLRDLRALHLAAVDNSLHWEMLAQAARATRDEALLVLASECHPRTLRQMRWTNTVIKNIAPQVLAVSPAR